MMMYDRLCAKLIVEKTQNAKTKNTPIHKNQGWLRFFPFLNFELDLASSTDWDIDA
jgi:hypothetical protein